ncbi:MAG TPA: hypothetical protein DCP91_01930, partial [Eggerthellaceae bacterium]|nr:hypothetical protein [Eggerthellaceae bacterium]
MQCGNRRRLGTGAWLGVAWCALSLVLGLTVGSAHAQGADDAASVDYAAGRLSAQESAVDLSVALRPGESAVQLASTGTADLSVLSDGDRDCLAAGKNTELAATVQGPGWLVFDWKFSAQGAYTNKLNLTVDGVENPNAAPNRSYDWFTDSSVVPLGANSSSSVKWATMVVQLDGEGPHTVKWTRAGTALNACLDDVHFTSSPNTAVSGIAGAGTASCALTVLDEDHRTVDAGSPLGADGVRPYGVVAFSAVPEQGKTFRGWKADPAAEEFVSTANPYIVRVYSDPVSLYAVCEQPFEGAGTPDDPYRIGARADLERLDAYVSAGESFADAHFAITSDIDCGDQPLSTIGAGASKSFSGQVDGRGHTIAFSGAGALFYAMAGAGVRNLCLDVDVNAADAVNAGALADRSTNGSSVADVVLRGRFFASRPASSWGTNFGYGGLVGSASGTTFSDCRIEADCSSDRQGNADPCLGAVVGYATSNCTIERCVVAGNVDGCGAASAVGGIVGGLTANSSCVTDCVVQGDVSGNARVGGIVGYQTGGTVSNCEYRGAVSAARRAGGIVGGLEGTGQVSSCLASGSISASEEQAGGIVGYASGYASLADNLCLAQAVEGGKRIVASCERSWGNGAWNTPVLQGNYAWAGTLVDGSAVATGDADASAGGLNGAVLEDADLLGSVAYEPCVRWPSASWNVQPGRKPQLAASNAVREQSGDLLPGYIRAYAEFPEFALAWTGAEVSIEAPADAGYALSGTTRGTDPGEYIARATLAEGYIWPDYTTAPIDFAWSITRTVAVPQFGPFAFAGSPVSVQAPAGAGYALSGQTTAAAVGSYEAVAT